MEFVKYQRLWLEKLDLEDLLCYGLTDNDSCIKSVLMALHVLVDACQVLVKCCLKEDCGSLRRVYKKVDLQFF